MKIGIPGWEDNGFFGVSSNYLNLAETYGTPVVITPGMTAEEVQSAVGMVILPGGADVLPSRYGEIPSFFTGRANPHLEHFDNTILLKLIKNKIPVFGICRGLQTINVLFGGKLNQHIYQHPKSFNDEDLVHKVVTKNGEEFKVNSFHHQAVSKLGVGLLMEARSDGARTYIEAISHSTLPVFAVQWHPERIFDAFSLDILKKLSTGGKLG